MAILVACECGQQFQTQDENSGRRARCPDCGRVLIVPKPGALLDEDFAPLHAIPKRGKSVSVAILLAAIAGGALFMVAILAALLLPAVQAAREAARRAQCTNNLKQIGLAMHNYHSMNNQFPAAAITGEDGKPLLSWRVAILPFIEQDGLYQQFHLDEPWDSPHNMSLLSQMPQTYACPSDPTTGPGNTTYQVVVGPGTMFTGGAGVKLADITDGTSNTIMVGEASRPVPWTAPDDIPLNQGLPNFGFGSKHPGGFNALFADGSVRFLRYTIAPSTLAALLTAHGGEVLSNSSF